MKKHLLSIIALGALTCVVRAQDKGDDQKNIEVIGLSPAPNEAELIAQTIELFYATHQSGVNQSDLPGFIIANRNHRMLLGIGGYVSLSAAYDFNGIVANTDFVTYDLPVPQVYGQGQQLIMDATTSRLFFKGIANTAKYGPVVAYLETDFRGINNDLRIRLAYIQVKGLLVGRNATTFCDLNGSFSTIDFEGPNAFSFSFNTMVRYTRNITPRLRFAVAVEHPALSMAETDFALAIPQRVPDIPLYLEYGWNGSHIRASAVFRDLIYQNTVQPANHHVFAWGVQLSGKFMVAKPAALFVTSIYGYGISRYLQDIAGRGLDLVPRTAGNGSMQTRPMWGSIVGTTIGLSPRLSCSGGYSFVRIYGRNGYYTPGQYQFAQYACANVIYNITGAAKVGMEYSRGSRQNVDGLHSTANRLHAMIQYAF